jgi:hypothetical protein
MENLRGAQQTKLAVMEEGKEKMMDRVRVRELLATN